MKERKRKERLRGTQSENVVNLDEITY